MFTLNCLHAIYAYAELSSCHLCLRLTVFMPFMFTLNCLHAIYAYAELSSCHLCLHLTIFMPFMPTLNCFHVIYAYAELSSCHFISLIKNELKVFQLPMMSFSRKIYDHLIIPSMLSNYKKKTHKYCVRYISGILNMYNWFRLHFNWLVNHIPIITNDDRSLLLNI